MSSGAERKSLKVLMHCGKERKKFLFFGGGNLEEETCVGGNLSKQIMTEHGSFASTFLTLAVTHDGFTWKMA